MNEWTIHGCILAVILGMIVGTMLKQAGTDGPAASSGNPFCMSAGDCRTIRGAH